MREMFLVYVIVSLFFLDIAELPNRSLFIMNVLCARCTCFTPTTYKCTDLMYVCGFGNRLRENLVESMSLNSRA